MPYRVNTVEALYRVFRAEQNEGLMDGHTYSHRIGAAATALDLARDERALQEAEGEDRIRFRWEYDSDIDSACDMDPPEDEAKCRAKIESGEWEALGCIAEVPEPCTHCGAIPTDDNGDPQHWTVSGSLWGIVIDVNDRYNYRREIERDLAAEAGVI